MPVSHHFCTLQRAVELRGIGLHSGQNIKIRLLPSSEIGVRFVRVDLPGAPEVSADITHVSATVHATVIESGEARVSTVEHLLAALWASGLTHVRVEIDGPEVPILDGSAAGWMELISQAGRQGIEKVRPIMRLHAPVWIESKGAQMMGLPLPFDGQNAQFRLSVGVNYDVAGAGAQQFDGNVTALTFASELASARTFTLEDWLEPLRQSGLIKGGSLENAIVVGRDGSASSILRFGNEFARHKALDCVGDLALTLCPLGASFHGHVIVIRGGHGVHRDWAKHALESRALTSQPR